MDPRRTPRLVAFAVTIALTFFMSAMPAHALMPRNSHRASVTRPRSALALTTGRELLKKINRSRVAHHRSRLLLNVKLSNVAWRHSFRMMKAGYIFHTADLTACILSNTNATRWGEDIAAGPSIPGIRIAWMKSPPHRQNILNGSFHRAGVGVVKSGDRFWITLDLYG